MESGGCPIHQAITGKSEDHRRGVPGLKREICGMPTEPMACVAASGYASQYENAAAFSAIATIMKNRAAMLALLSGSRRNRRRARWAPRGHCRASGLWRLGATASRPTRAFSACLWASHDFRRSVGAQAYTAAWPATVFSVRTCFVNVYCPFAPKSAAAKCGFTQSILGSPIPTRYYLSLAGVLVREF